MAKYARGGSQVWWMERAANEVYWSVGSKQVSFSGEVIAGNVQQVIFDNGMSLAKIPEKAFVNFVKLLYNNHGLDCSES